MKTLQIRSQNTSITVKTLAEKENHTTFPLQTLRVYRHLDLNQEWIGFAKRYTKGDLPIDSSEVATVEKLKMWKHLSCVADEVIKSN